MGRYLQTHVGPYLYVPSVTRTEEKVTQGCATHGVMTTGLFCPKCGQALSDIVTSRTIQRIPPIWRQDATSNFLALVVLKEEYGLLIPNIHVEEFTGVLYDDEFELEITCSEEERARTIRAFEAWFLSHVPALKDEEYSVRWGVIHFGL